ncbi:MAG: hypothetical protein ACLRZ9_05875 [Eubacterium sp.]
MYIKSAVGTAIENCFAERPKSKYINKPMLQDFEDRNKQLTEEEKQREVDLFFAREKARRVNWKRNHNKQSD